MNFDYPFEKEIFDLKKKGLDTQSIADALNNRGLKTAMGKPFTRNHIYNSISKYNLRAEKAPKPAFAAKKPFQVKTFEIETAPVADRVFVAYGTSKQIASLMKELG